MSDVLKKGANEWNKKPGRSENESWKKRKLLNTMIF